MRTTLDLDEDILLAVRELAERESTSMGRVLSRLARSSLTRVEEGTERNGVPLFPRQPGGKVVTPELIKQLRDDDGV